MTALPPLLAIAEGHKPHARKASILRPRESKLHCDVADLLRAHCLPEWDWNFINAKAKDAREGAIFKRMGANAGWPDFILIAPRGPVHFLELKRTGEDLSDTQKEFRLRSIKRGTPYVIARTMDEAIEALDWFGCLRIKVARP